MAEGDAEDGCADPLFLGGLGGPVSSQLPPWLTAITSKLSLGIAGRLTRLMMFTDLCCLHSNALCDSTVRFERGKERGFGSVRTRCQQTRQRRWAREVTRE